jgi:hypothetical protein
MGNQHFNEYWVIADVGGGALHEKGKPYTIDRQMPFNPIGHFVATEPLTRNTGITGILQRRRVNHQQPRPTRFFFTCCRTHRRSSRVESLSASHTHCRHFLTDTALHQLTADLSRHSVGFVFSQAEPQPAAVSATPTLHHSDRLNNTSSMDWLYLS